MHTQCVLKIENFVSCDMNLEEALDNEQTAQITSHRSLIFWDSVLIPLASELTIKRRFSCNPALLGQNIYVYSGHIHVSFAFFQLFLKNNR